MSEADMLREIGMICRREKAIRGRLMVLVSSESSWVYPKDLSHEMILPPWQTNKTTIVHIESGNYENIQPSLNKIKDKWFINLSGTPIPHDIQCFLQLGEETIHMRGFSRDIIKTIPSHTYPKNDSDDWLISSYSSTIQFLNNNKNVILTKADKGNVTVALDKNEYVTKVENLLADESTYIIVKKDPIKKLISDLRDLLVRWKNRGHISTVTYKSLLFTDGTLPRAYGLPKIHKPNTPYRLIVSSINSPLHSLAIFLHKLMVNNFPTPPSYVKNSFDIVNKLNNTHLDEDLKFISLDVISLFTNIPTNLALDCISNKWEYLSNNCDLSEAEFLNGIKLILNCTYFIFNNVIYRQTFETPMGPPLSPIIADIVLQDLEKKALNTLHFNPPFYFRFVDDIIMAVPSDSIDYTPNTFNST
ncbi:uncharacterized protein [Anoplolepis gracilipes]|uniref:uncharacterized protein n=1 Tax=Anoplolepis gracilipes TaxID=354296 RepID=UPI003BA1CBA7